MTSWTVLKSALINWVCKSIYCDNEGAFVSNIVKHFLTHNIVKLITTNGHAPVDERHLRTIKNMMYQRIEKTGQAWRELLYPVILVYNNKLIHSVTKMTPADAMKQTNQIQVRLNL